MTSQDTQRNGRNLWSVRLRAVMLAAAMIVSSGGCLTTEFVSSDEPPTVTQAVAKRDLGIDYLSSRRTAMAIRELRASLNLDSDDPQTHLWLGESYRRKGRMEEAEAYLLESIRLSVGDDTQSLTEQAARLTLSALLSQMGRYEDSLEHCEALTEDATFGTPWMSLTNCGWALMKLGRTDEARAHFDEALDFFPRFGPALLNLGILQAEEGHALLATRTLQRAIDSGRLAAPGMSEAHFRLGEIYVGLGRRDMAVEQFEASTTKSPYGDWGTQSQAYLDILH